MPRGELGWQGNWKNTGDPVAQEDLRAGERTLTRLGERGKQTPPPTPGDRLREPLFRKPSRTAA